ncbi:MAG: hypothetical protein ABL882_05705 [Sphingopyxis sp.]
MELVAILTGLIVLACFTIWSGNRAAGEVERTLRLAIDKGVLTDAALIPALREPAGLSWIERLTIFGLLTLFASGGIVLVALILSVFGPGIPLPLFALAAFATSIGFGLIVCAGWLKRARGAA